MRIRLSKPISGVNELMEVLKEEFPGQYKYELFGLGKNKTILMRKSALVGAQISVHDQEVTIQSTAGSPTAAYFITFLSFTELIIFVSVLFGWSLHNEWRTLEKSLGQFLAKKYQLA